MYGDLEIHYGPRRETLLTSGPGMPQGVTCL